MKKIIALSLIICMFLSGCEGERTTYFDDYQSIKDDHVCKVQGTVYQMASDYNGILTYVTAPDDFGCINVTGSMDCIEGKAQLVYTAPDGTETLIADEIGGRIDTQIHVAEGEGTVNFISKGKSAVYRFDFIMEAEDSAVFSSAVSTLESNEEMIRKENITAMEDMEVELSPEIFMENYESIPENLEKIEKLDSESMEGTLDDFAFEEIEDNWPEYIRYSGDGLYANPLVISIEVEEPMTLSLSCVTIDGKLELKIVDHDRKTVYFDEIDPNGNYTVDIQNAGTYQILLYAKYHVGGFELRPVEN